MSVTEQTVGELLNEHDWTGKIFSDGWVDAPETIETVEPATGEVLGAAGVADARVGRRRREVGRTRTARLGRDADDRARRGRRAAPAELLDAPPARRSRRGWCASPGCIPRQGRRRDQRRRSASSTRPPSLISHPLGHVLPSLTPGRTSTARRVPIGVVGVITPWNFPIVLAMRSLGPALALGNAVVLKSDPNTPVTGGVIIARLFEEAGLPEGVLHVLRRRRRGRAGARRGPERSG